MMRICFLVLGLVSTIATAGGCRSCASCHDYDPPVANCDCNACGTQRAGSVHSGYVGMYAPPLHAQEDAAEEELPPAQVANPQQQSQMPGPQFWN